jgi:hypothetical protein
MASFFDFIQSFFSKQKKTAAEQKRALKKLTKSITANRYHHFYKPKTGTVEPSFARAFYNMYRVVAPAQIFMQNAALSPLLKQTIVDAYLDRTMLETGERLTEEAIEERVTETPPRELTRQVREEFQAMADSIDTIQRDAIDGCYNLIMAFTKFISFDFYFLIRKFSPEFREQNFSKTPTFESIKAEYVIEPLKDFLEIAAAVDPAQDWRAIFSILKLYRNGADVLNTEQWYKLLYTLREIKQSTILELMVRHIDKNPAWVSKPRVFDEHITGPLLEEKRHAVEEIIERVINSKWKAQKNILIDMIFGNIEISGARYYTEEAGDVLVKRNFEGFTQAEGFSYLMAFMNVFFNPGIKDLCELLVIQGQWIPSSLSLPISEAIYTLQDLQEQLGEFDESMAETGSNGSELYHLLGRYDRDQRYHHRFVNSTLKKINAEARELVIIAVKNFTILKNSLKDVLDDAGRNPHVLIVNWRDLESRTGRPLEPWAAKICKKIADFVQMEQFMSQWGGEE